VRERWATVANEALQEAHIDARVDHRSLAAQGIDREPYPYIPRAAFEMERHGYRSDLAERMRADYQARVQARIERGAAPELTSRAERALPTAPAQPQTLEEIRRRARENWLRMRQEAAETRVDTPERSRDDDLSR
jgi:hypothetical protein